MLRVPVATAAVLLSLLTVGSARPRLAQESPTDVAAALQAKYDRVRDFTADFKQHYVTLLKKKASQHSGKVQIKKPGKMRWDYTTPEKQLFVSDGSTIYLWVEADNQVTVTPVPRQETAATSMLFLVGKGNIVRDFSVSFLPKTPADAYGLRLEPKQPERDYDWLELVVDRSNMQIRQLTAADRQGGQNTLTFSNFKENVGLSDKTFEFKIPRGADVIHAGTSPK
jgi:outer membrane lipoprotein carrier protein